MSTLTQPGRPAAAGTNSIAIVGMGVLFPGAPDLRTYWNNLLEGSDAITEVPPRRWDARYYQPDPVGATRANQIYCRRGGFVDDLAMIDPFRFGLTKREAAEIDPEQLIALRVAAAAVDDAGGVDRLGDPGKVGVILGNGGHLSPGLVRLDQRVRTARQLAHTLGTLLPTLSAADLERIREAFTDALGPSPAASLGPVSNLVAARVAQWLDANGPAYTIDAACASSLVAVDAAVGELTSGRCDAVLAGGVHHCHDVTLWSSFSKLGMLSASQRIRPFHQEADGLLLGEGTGVVVLKRLDDALAAGDRIYAVVRGTGVSSSGRHPGAPSPDPASAALAVERAWAAAGLDPRQPGVVGLIEAHGAGTVADDLAELAIIRQVFGPPADDDLGVIGSVKSMIGHAMPAAGIAGLIKAALAVHNGVLLPTLNCDQPHPAVETTRFRPLMAACPWAWDGLRRAGVNAFGLGGVNAHVVLEQAPPAGEDHGTLVTGPPVTAGRTSVTEPEQVLRFAAPTPEDLVALLDGDDATLRQRGAGQPSYVGPGSRLGLVGPSERRLAVARKVAKGSRSGGWAAWRGRNDVWLSSEPLLAPSPGRIAFVFPGLEAEFSPRIDDVAEHFGLPPLELSTEGVGEHGTGVLRIGRVLEVALRGMGVLPEVLAGHSIGEWSAMFASGMFDEGHADEMIFGSVMDDLAARDVDYASLACPVNQALAAIADFPELTLSHDNAPQQTLVCGPPGAIRALAARQRQANVLVQILPFRSGFHTPALAPYIGEIARRVENLPILRGAGTELRSATLVDRYPDRPEDIRELFLRHLLEPVRFRPMVLAMYQAGVRVFIQVGQGRLSGLISDTLGSRPHLTIAANSGRRSGLDQLRRVAVALWVEGGSPIFEALETRGERAAQLAPNPRSGQLQSASASSEQNLVRLDLGSQLVTLDPSLLPQPAEAEAFAGAAGLTAWARRDPMAHELLELLTDTAHTAVAALESSSGTGAGPSNGRRVWLDPVERREPQQVEAFTTQLTISMETMPYLIDHCLAPQTSGWREVADLRPVVPATTMVRMAMDLAEKAAPGRVAIGVSDIRFDRWLPAAPPTELTVAVQPAGTDRVSVTFGAFARVLVRLADGYPETQRPVWPHQGAMEQQPTISGPELYSKRWMFHGPQFQGVVSFLGYGESHVRAILSPTAAPGSLLDAAGQLLAYYARMNLPERFTIFPAAIDRIDFYGPEPAPGTPVTCLVWVPPPDEEWLRAFFQLVVDGQVWAEVNGWVDRRFDLRPESDEVFRFPERNTVSQTMPGGWMMATEPWSDLASRELFAVRYLGAAERQELEDQPPRARRQWFLSRIVLKDAVRASLWETGQGPIYPAELTVTTTSAGLPSVVSDAGRGLPQRRVSVAHSNEMAVALARQPAAGSGDGIGIDIEEIRDHPRSTVDAALTPEERDLMNDLASETGLTSSQWFTRFWAAKEASAKAVGIDLGDAPRRFVVRRAGDAADQLLVTVPAGGAVTVSLAEISNPPELTRRDYVVAWTGDPQEQRTSGGTS
jgi:acyl transferase domain-containing protein